MPTQANEFCLYTYKGHVFRIPADQTQSVTVLRDKTPLHSAASFVDAVRWVDAVEG